MLKGIRPVGSEGEDKATMGNQELKPSDWQNAPSFDVFVAC